MIRQKPITVREDPAVAEGIHVRAAELRPSSINEQERTVRAVFATETPVRVFHWDVGRVIDEVLVARGMEPVDYVPMVEMHNHYRLDAVIGSGEQPAADGGEIVGTLRFGSDLGDQVDAIWRRVVQRHLRNVSAGYDPLEWVDIQPGESREVNGRSYTAGQRMLRVTTCWRLREISMVVIPADQNASIRGNNGAGGSRAENGQHEGESSQRPQSTAIREGEMGFLAYLRSLGLAENADAQAIRSFVGGLNRDQRARAQELANQAERSAYFDQGGAPGDGDGSGNGPGEGSGNQPGSAAPSPATDPMLGVTGARGGDGGNQPTQAETLTTERSRVAEIMRLANGEVADDLVQRAISDGWSVDRAGREFYQSVQSQRSAPVGHGGHVGIHSRSASSEVTLQALQVGLMMRQGIEPDNQYLSTMQARGMLERSDCNAGWLVDAAYAMRNGNPGDEASRAIDVASRRLRRRSIPDIAADCLRMAGIQFGDDREEMIRRAYTVSQFANIFTTNFSARLLMGYMEQADSTAGWCAEEDLPNFQDHELIQMDPFTNLRKKTRNLPGQQVEGGDRKETYAASRWVGTFNLDEQAMMDDNMRGFSRAPLNLGASARRLRPNLVYAILLQNPNLASGTALFDASTHANLAGSAALGSATLSAAEAAMAIQTRNGAVLDIMATHLIVPRTKRHLAQRLVGSAVMDDPSASAEYGTMNPNRGEYTVVSDARLDNGFTDPDDPHTSIAGQPNSWFLADANAPGIVVGYVQGSGRAPRIRSRVIDRSGEYGMEWDVNMDIGAAPADYVGLLKRQTASL